VEQKTIADVVERMRAILDGLPPRDGVACFTRLYLAVTEAVNEAKGSFTAPAFLTQLDICFARLYFDALDHPPRAWAPLLDARARPGVAPIQFALCGMNAHINRDLPVALVESSTKLGVELSRRGPEHADYLAVNRLLVSTEARVKKEFLTDELALADDALGTVDDVIAVWNVERARDAAWANAETLWALRSSPDLAAAFMDALDGMVGFAGRGLVVPTT
jgi:Family of unknown function (DUF5995)